MNNLPHVDAADKPRASGREETPNAPTTYTWRDGRLEPSDLSFWDPADPEEDFDDAVKGHGFTDDPAIHLGEDGDSIEAFIYERPCGHRHGVPRYFLDLTLGWSVHQIWLDGPGELLDFLTRAAPAVLACSQITDRQEQRAKEIWEYKKAHGLLAKKR